MNTSLCKTIQFIFQYILYNIYPVYLYRISIIYIIYLPYQQFMTAENFTHNSLYYRKYSYKIYLKEIT